jgi:hypothetical protein
MLSLTFLESLWRGKGLKYPKWFKNRSTFEYDPGSVFYSIGV